ncbi:Uncharacterised protein [uncultured archaeon]|nr:Uncharacterised protein [uncultured archaeon]
MTKGLEFKSPWVVLKIAFLMVIFLTVASGDQTPCGKGDQSCDQGWNLLAGDLDASVLALGSAENLIAEMNSPNIADISFDFQNQSASAEVQNIVTGNDTAEIIRLKATDIDSALLNYVIISPPDHGNLSGTAPNIIYTPEEGYTGNDSVVIGVSDGIGGEQTVSIAIDVLELYHPPSVRIRSPQNGDIFRAYPITTPPTAEVPVHVTASGSVETISLEAIYDTTSRGYTKPCPARNENDCPDCPVTFLLDLDVGIHTLIAKANESPGGKTCGSLPVVITVNPPEPYVEITSPYDGQIFTAPADITVEAKVIDSNSVLGVEFFANSVSIGTKNVSPYSISWTGVKPGVYHLVAKATDAYNSAISRSVLIVVVPVKALTKSDLAITKSSSSDPAPAGGLMNYLLTVTNRGPDSSSDVTVQDFLPPGIVYVTSKASQGEYVSGVWSLGGLDKYRSAKLVITVRTPSTVPPGQVSNTAYVYGSELDPDNSNNYATTYTRLRAGNTSPG